MKLDRMKHLHKILTSIPDAAMRDTRDGHRRFCMHSWFSVVATEPVLELKVDKDGTCKHVEVEEGFCRTSACALGHAALDPKFQKQGLKVVWDQYSDGEVRYRGHANCVAAEKFFGITNEQALWLFIPSSYSREPVKPSDVARRVKQLIDDPDLEV